ncbi:MAG: cupin domain-containing protein [Ardenticatenaceae bacterium]|nr:cupin domain-containing protein [Ardenticatenaceae bacterium]MCB9446543.1 cupin domain-containing protein [Ardenticatenaceae bacterium]
MELVKRIDEHVGANAEKFYKTTLFRSDTLLLGLNCLEPGQVQKAHDHANQDKFYYVVAGNGRFQLGEEQVTAGAGEVVWAPAGVVHGVTNESNGRLTLLVGIAPAP